MSLVMRAALALSLLLPLLQVLAVTAAAILVPSPSAAQLSARVAQGSSDEGEMTSGLNASGAQRQQALRFEPFDMLHELTRDDIVLLMRHGPTDWSRLDSPGVAPTDCANQRMLSSEGQTDMEELGVLLADNGIRPGTIVVSEWCRNQETAERLLRGFATVDPSYAALVRVETDPGSNLLLSLQGAPNVTALRQRIMNWRGDSRGSILIISHFTNIAELTQFDVYEGEILVIDPARNGRVLGYLRLASAGPDIGHFPTAFVGPQ